MEEMNYMHRFGYFILSYLLISLLFCGCSADITEKLGSFLELNTDVSVPQIAGDNPDSQFLLYSIIYINDMSNLFTLADDNLDKSNWKNLITVGRDVTQITQKYPNQIEDITISKDLLNFKNECATGQVYLNQYGILLESLAKDVNSRGLSFTSQLSMQAERVDKCRSEGQYHLEQALIELNNIDFNPYLTEWIENAS